MRTSIDPASLGRAAERIWFERGKRPFSSSRAVSSRLLKRDVLAALDAIDVLDLLHRLAGDCHFTR